MKYFIDTAEQSEIEKWKGYICGATSNPSLLAKANLTPYKFYENNINILEHIFIQVNDVELAHSILKNDILKKVIFKIPLLITDSFDGFYWLNQLIKLGARTCATIVYDLHQFNYACEVESEFCVVLFAKNENKRLLGECSHLKRKQGFKTKIVAASFRDSGQVIECIKNGADYATIPPSIMPRLFSNPRTISDYNKFYGIK